MTTASELRSGKTHRDENFPVASWIIHPRHRALILAFYNFVRTADDIADHASLGAPEKLAYLDLLEAELLGNGNSQPEAVKLREALMQRAMPPRHALDVLTAFRMDVSKLRYENWDEVIHYCRYSAMPVGRFMLDVHGVRLQAHDQRFERRRDVRVVRGRQLRILENHALYHDSWIFVIERNLPAQNFVQHGAQTVEIAALVDRQPLGLLRRHVVWGA